MRARKSEEERRERAKIAEDCRAAASAAAATASSGGNSVGSGLAYREEALRRTEQMARGAAPLAQSSELADASVAVPPEATSTAVVTQLDQGAEGAGGAGLPSTTSESELPSPPPPLAPAAKQPAGASALAPALAVPEHSLLRSMADAMSGASSGEVLTLKVSLPLVTSMKQLSLSMSECEVLLEMAEDATHTYAPLTVALPTSVDVESGRARFDRKRGVLVVSLPIAAADEHGNGTLV